jgi:hypothetical protein
MKIEVQFQPTPDDWKAYQRHAARAAKLPVGNAPLGFRWQAILGGAVVGMALGFGDSFWPSFIDIHMPTAMLLVGAILVLYCFYRWKWSRGMVPLDHGALLAPRRLWIDDAGVGEESAHHRHFSAWAGIVAVHETDAHVFLMVDRLAGYILPKRAFTSAEALAEFTSTSRQRASGPRASQ